MPGVNDEVIGAVVGSALSGVVAMMAAFLGARWAARFTDKSQRAARLHDTLVALYADVFADIHMSQRYLDSAVEPFVRVHGDRPDRARIGGRLLLFSSPAVQAAWDAYVWEMDNFIDYVNNSTNVPHGDLLNTDNKLLRGCQEKIDALQTAVTAHLTNG